MSKRIPSRHRNGRYRKATLENTFGLTAPVCPHCGGLNPHGVNEPAPDVCGQCGQSMAAVPPPEQPPAKGHTEEAH